MTSKVDEIPPLHNLDYSQAKPNRFAEERLSATTVKESCQQLMTFVDRIEDDVAVIVLSDAPDIHFNLPLQYLPPNVTEGDHLKLTLELDPKSKEATRHRVAALQAELSPDPETNIKL